MSASNEPAPLKLGPYELLQRIATGGMAEVYLARRGGPYGFQKIVAVKRILPQLSRDSDFVAMFIDEARVAARLGHPNIVQVFDFGEEEDEMYMAMEYVDGTTGARLIRAAAAQDEPIPLDVSMQVVLAVARALEHAHAAKDEEGKPLHLVHRDVSPGNVLIDRSGAVKLTDFGIVRAEEVERRTEAGQLKGKLGYMSPEQVVGRELDGRSDIFTLGIVLAEMIMLKPLFSGGGELDVLIRIRDANLKPLDQDTRVPDDVRGILLRALARDPANRFASASQFAEAIEEVIRRRRLHVSPVLIASFGERLGVFAPELNALPDDELSTANVLASERETSMPPANVTIDPSKEMAPAIWRVEDEDAAAHDGNSRHVSESMSYPKIVELFATGGIGRTARIARESGEFRAPSHYPELARFVKSPALSWEPLFPPETIERAPIAHGDFPSRIFDLVMRKDTGVLVLRDGERKKKVYFVEGTPEFIASTDKRELLGENLVDAGSVLRMEVDMALAMLPRYGGRLGDALVGLGVLRPIELFRAVHQQMQVRFLEIFTWSRGEMGFVRGARSHEETFPLGIDPLELVVRGVREAFAAAEIISILSPIEDTRLKATAALPMRLDALHLPHRESTLLRSIEDGETRSMRELVTESLTVGMTQHEVRFALFLGLSAGLLRSA